jgi:hypothetical protein
MLPWAGNAAGRAENRVKQLLAETRLYGDALASLGATAGNDGPSALGLHARTKPVRLGPATTVGLECALGHSRTALLTGKKLDRANQKYTVRQARLANRPVSQGRVMSAGKACGREWFVAILVQKIWRNCNVHHARCNKKFLRQ